VVSADRVDAVDNIKLLAASGVGIEIDDFGMGAAGLSRLTDLPVRTVTISGALEEGTPRQLDDDSWEARALTDLVALIHQSGASVTVTGVDTADQAEWWRRLAADSAIGRFFASAREPDDITDRLKREK
jgi:EAL domain-containing protein (putative c-di-GMP-specific phosphodiesterase class I)